MSDIVSPFLTGLEYCAGAFGIILLAIIPLPLIIKFGRWMYPAPHVDDSLNSGAQERVMSREEAKLWSDEAI
jgi:hypothetical protein